MNLEDYDTEAIEKELKKRAKEAKEVETIPVPLNMALNDRLDFAEIVKACKDYIQDIEDGRAEVDKEWIFESAMETVYGKDIWDWVNKKLK